MTWVLVGLGAVVGAPSRYLIDVAVTRRFGARLPWGTLVVNLTGSFLLGLTVGLAGTGEGSTAVLALVGVGFCGTFTTASTLAWEVLALAEEGFPRRAVAGGALCVVLGLALAATGLALGTGISE